ncbi:hypothetical protein NUW58_g3317 [Xylaria curta]|uniref:Uncharacterized protein n=1 Tax=Xylaria curta TaxID=42375 RepID=A0ACC1PCV6_9PEZI|nr:hypothetical protein NUW58_g3317 [Xylaria curta]
MMPRSAEAWRIPTQATNHTPHPINVQHQLSRSSIERFIDEPIFNAHHSPPTTTNNAVAPRRVSFCQDGWPTALPYVPEQPMGWAGLGCLETPSIARNIANHITVVNSVIESIRDGVQKEDLLAAAKGIRDNWKLRAQR